jgi:two-component system LytT family response regulator
MSCGYCQNTVLLRLPPRPPDMMLVPRLHHEAIHTVSAMIVDGSPASIRRLRAAINDHPRIAVGCTARTIAAAIEQAAEHHPDVVFLDIGLAEDDRLAVARHLATWPAVVFVADRPDFAFEAFEFGAIDYLLKPIREERLRETLRRIDRFFAHSSGPSKGAGTGASSARLSSSDRVSIPSSPSKQRTKQLTKQRKTTELLPVADVIWIESLQNYSVVQLPGSDRRSIKRTLSEWATLLSEREFVRIGRSHLIQIAKIKSITSPCRNEVLVSFHGVEQPLRIGRAASSKLKRILRGSSPA